MKNKKSVYIFGASTNGLLMWRSCQKKGIPVIGFLDNYYNGPDFCNLPMVRPSRDLEKHQVVITSPNYCTVIEKQLRELGFSDIINSCEMNARLHVGQESQWKEEMILNRMEYANLFNMLGDEKSQIVLQGITAFRKSFNTWHTEKIKSDHIQWFDEDFFNPNLPHVFVDGGAYDGETTRRFLERCADYKSVYMFEPCTKLAHSNRRMLYDLKFEKVYSINLGLSDGYGFSKLKDSGELHAELGNEGDTVNIARLDDIVKEKITFLKLDIEGSEQKAIHGSIEQIKSNHPFMAIAVYHKTGDIWQIPKLIKSIDPTYKFYLRHYTQFYHETVLYCI